MGWRELRTIGELRQKGEYGSAPSPLSCTLETNKQTNKHELNKDPAVIFVT
jgi:hypothetical protein